jgi:inner membrane transporter RhtA
VVAIPAPALVLLGIVSVQVGSALAKQLFDEVGSFGTVALRLFFAAAVLMLLWRPSPALLVDRDAWPVVLGYGVILGLMNLSFYLALDRLPLGIAVTIEFLGPLGVALAGSRRAHDVGWVLLAGAGVAMLTLGDGAGEPLELAGVLLSGVSAVCWAGYILLTKRVGARWAGFEGLSVSLAVAALVSLPMGIAGAGSELLEPAVLLAGIGLALLIPLLPYALELVALRRLPTALFGVIMSLEPAIAALLGFLILDQALAVTGVVAIAMVSVASAGATLGAREAPDEPPSLGA